MSRPRHGTPVALVARAIGAAGLAALVLVLAACGSSGRERTAGGPRPTVTTTTGGSPVSPASSPTVGTLPGALGSKGTAVEPPSRLRIGSIGVDARVLPVGVEVDGALEVPPAAEVGWYQFGPVPGAAGSAVLAAHVDYDGEAGAFFRMRELEISAPVEVELADGDRRSFVVTELLQVPKSELDPDWFARSGAARLVLITCGGEFDRSARSYRDNVVAIAERVA